MNLKLCKKPIKLNLMRKILLLFTALFVLFLAKADAHTREISGKVVSKDGESLIGVSILVKGTNKGVSTDVSGNFKITVPTTGATLVVKYIGYKTQEVAVGTQSSITVTMLEADSKILNEINIVNIGYGTVSRDAITGSVSSVSAKDIKDYPVSTAAEALAGKLAGVTVTTTEGKP